MCRGVAPRDLEFRLNSYNMTYDAREWISIVSETACDVQSCPQDSAYIQRARLSAVEYILTLPCTRAAGTSRATRLCSGRALDTAREGVCAELQRLCQ